MTDGGGAATGSITGATGTVSPGACAKAVAEPAVTSMKTSATACRPNMRRMIPQFATAQVGFLRYGSVVAGRTFAVGDIHGDLTALETLFERLPTLNDDDTIVFLGDYMDRGPESAGVIKYVRALARKGPANVITLRGNHEDAWLQVVDKGWPEFVLPRGNGALES